MSEEVPDGGFDPPPKPWSRTRRRHLAGVLLLPSLLLLRWMSAEAPQAVEDIYSQAVFPTVQSVLSTVASWLPFSAGEAMTALLSIGLIAWMVRVVRTVRRATQGRRALLLGATCDALGFAGVLYAAFLLAWGLNFSRVSLPQHLELDQRPAEVEELVALVRELVEASNRYRADLPENDAGTLLIEGGTDTVFAELQRLHATVGDTFPQYAGTRLTPRVPMLSSVLSNAGISGIYWPFTGEMHVNGQLPASSLPFVACHEAAHAWGVPREDEANLVAAMVCGRSASPLFRYSGAVTSLTYAGNALSSADAERARELLSRLSPAVLRDRENVRLFWTNARGVLSPVARASNDAYLKSQGQALGARSYGAVVDLLVAERRRAQRRDRRGR